MMLPWLLATLHLLALGIGLGAVWARGRALRSPLDAEGVRRALTADNWWGVAAVLWLGTGLWRLFGSVEKSTTYYFQDHVFWTKMLLFLAILLLEIWPMITLINWRRQFARGAAPDLRAAPKIAKISAVQTVLVIAMVLAATAMARGLGVVSD